MLWLSTHIYQTTLNQFPQKILILNSFAFISKMKKGFFLKMKQLKLSWEGKMNLAIF